MIDFNLSTTQLAMIWAFAGLICIIPLFRVCKLQKFVVVPIVFLAIYLSFVTNLDFIGKPYYKTPDKFLYKHHTVETIDSTKWITLWAMVDKRDSLYRFQWNKKDEKQLKRAQKRSRQGTPQIGEFKKKGKGKKFQPGGELEIYDFPYQEQIPKLTQ